MPGVAVEKEADGTLAADEVPVGIGALVADDSGSYDAAIRAQLYPLLELTGVLRDNVGDGGMHAEYQYQSLATRIFSLYEVLDDAARSVPILERRKNSRTGRFNSTRLGALQQFVLGVGGAGLSVREQKQLYDFLEIWDRRDAVDPMETRDDLSLSAVFPTVSSFTKALRDDLDDAVLSAGWKKLKIREGGTVYEVYYRSVLEVVMARLQKGDGGVRLWSGEDGPAPPTNMRQTPMDGDAFRLCEKEVVATHGGTSFVLGLHLYSDSSQLSWSGAHKLYPVRVRLVNDDTGDIHWMTVAYIPLVRIQVEKAAKERSRLRRCGILQRVLYVCMRTAMAASRFGVEVRMGGQQLMAFTRVLLYVCDQPEERAVLCLKAGQCQRPCSQCDVMVDVAGSSEALDAAGRDVVETLERQLEASGHRQHGRSRARREDLEAVDSLTGFVPALAAMEGLSTSPYLLYKMIGFDALHVLDLGVTRMLVQWLVEVFPKICKGHMPLAGTDAATRRVCNKRIDHLGRRSKACKTPPGYLVKHDEPQSVYTGKQQREGVSTMAFLVAGAWRTRGALPVPALPVRGGVAEIGEAALPVGDGLQDAVPDLAARVAALRLDEAPEEGAASDDPRASQVVRSMTGLPTMLFGARRRLTRLLPQCLRSLPCCTQRCTGTRARRPPCPSRLTRESA
ncbi:hypothetical protein I4F81_009007 [Pyropia yezoensis]|uniref:Uncharacterized protein n=1 Tax=Pyropia yezoensis TaxID=2788 RepID=A0ACC3C8L9_PYRYE|nr:hypothetical protein I4F81_009007 [Neopyropia yezoensis]